MPRASQKQIRYTPQQLPPAFYVISWAITLLLIAIFKPQGSTNILLWLMVAILFIARIKFNNSKPLTDEPAPKNTIPLVIGIITAGALIRLAWISNYFPWPTGDESETAVIAWRWMTDGWNGRLFQGFAQIPAAYHALLALTFKLNGISFNSMWLLPALLSIISLPLVYLASRQYLDVRMALYTLIFYSFGIWPLLMCRFNLPVMTPILVFVACLYTLGSIRTESSTKINNVHVLLSGFLIGLGFLVYGAWILTAGVLVLIAWIRLNGVVDKWKYLIRLFLASAPGTLIFIYAAIQEGFGSHIKDRSLLLESSFLSSVMKAMIHYSQIFLAGIPNTVPDYSPIWGGLLNPLVAVLFLEGFVLLILHLRPSNRIPTSLVFILLITPGIVSKGVEPYRILPAFLLALGVAGYGLGSLLRTFKDPKTRLIAVFLFLTLCSSMDIYQFLIPYRSAGMQWDRRLAGMRDIESAKVNNALQAHAEKNGPGWIFSEFRARKGDPSLWIRSHKFNNMLGKSDQGNWFAFLLNVHYRPFLEKRYPHATFTDLDPDNRTYIDGPSILVIIPIDTSSRLALDEMIRVHQILFRLARTHIAQANKTSQENELKSMVDLYRQAKDPLLISVLAEKILLLIRNERGLSNTGSDERLYALTGEILRSTLDHGYPAAHLLNKYGHYCAASNNWKEAEKAWMQAVASPGNVTPAAENLKLLRERMKGK